MVLMAASARASPWSEVQTPTPGPTRVIGVPVAGCLASPAALPFDRPGIEVIHVSHETGLDVDIWFNLAPKAALAPTATRPKRVLPANCYRLIAR